MKSTGSVTIHLKAVRNVGSASTPCNGYYELVEHLSENSTRRLNAPSMFDLANRALQGLPAIDSELEVTITVKVTKAVKQSTKKCHNPWPAHKCRP
jgi:hypothetical protein